MSTSLVRDVTLCGHALSAPMLTLRATHRLSCQLSRWFCVVVKIQFSSVQFAGSFIIDTRTGHGAGTAQSRCAAPADSRQLWLRAACKLIASTPLALLRLLLLGARLLANGLVVIKRCPRDAAVVELDLYTPAAESAEPHAEATSTWVGAVLRARGIAQVQVSSGVFIPVCAPCTGRPGPAPSPHRAT